MKNQISEVRIVPIKPNNGLVAFASFILDSKLYLSSIAVHKKLDGSGYRLTYPTKQVCKKDFSLFHPIAKELGQEIEQAIFQKLKKVMEGCNDRYSNTKCSIW